MADTAPNETVVDNATGAATNDAKARRPDAQGQCHQVRQRCRRQGEGRGRGRQDPRGRRARRTRDDAARRRRHGRREGRRSIRPICPLGRRRGRQLLQIAPVEAGRRPDRRSARFREEEPGGRDRHRGGDRLRAGAAGQGRARRARPTTRKPDRPGRAWRRSRRPNRKASPRWSAG